MTALILVAVVLAASPSHDEAAGGIGQQKLRARRLFEVGDYAACEKELRALLSGPAGPGTPDHVECLAHLARALTFQDIHDEAIAVINKAIRLDQAPALRRLAVTVLLRAGRLAEVLPHAEFLLAEDRTDPFAHFVRGIALSAKGHLEEARGELAWGLKTPGAKRDAHYHLAVVHGKLNQPEKALEHLLEILADDPYDHEACYQATQQLIRLRTASSKKAAAELRRYFLAFTTVQGETSRDYPLAAAGRAAQAALLRADKWKRLAVYDRTLAEIRRAQAVARGDPEPFLYEADFWAGVGLFAEAQAALSRLEAKESVRSKDVAARVQKLRKALAAGLHKVELQANTPLGKARLKGAKTPWAEAGPALKRLLVEAIAAGALPLADRTARLLLARDPQSARALAFLAERAEAPSLLVPRLHYLTRLVRLLPKNDRFREQLRCARRELLGAEGA